MNGVDEIRGCPGTKLLSLINSTVRLFNTRFQTLYSGRILDLSNRRPARCVAARAGSFCVGSLSRVQLRHLTIESSSMNGFEL